MAATNNPLAGPAAPAPAVSMTTLLVAGLLVDVYGLDELQPSATAVTCLWLHHPRLRRKEDMAAIANETVSAFHGLATSSASATPTTRGLIAVAFDQRNHGSRLVHDIGNQAWRQGNPRHAQDMFTTVSGTVSDTVHLMDVLEAYLFGAGDGPGLSPEAPSRRIDSHMVLGVSLGGHSAWQLLFADPRVTAGVVVIGCPDYMNMVQDRARLSKLETFTVDGGFIGSKDFPQALVAACEKYDPKAILFGTGPIVRRPTSSEQDRLRPILDSRVAGKRFQILSGGDDKLVPYHTGAKFLEFLRVATDGWYQEGNVHVEDQVFPGVGHEFNQDMHQAAVRFILDTVNALDGSDRATSSKI
ncbi:hypothetical protein F4777DRAFT_191967 [Nemania sp. FL0916]|nr:hypothetical protein F4777DRAFT_191967 [Nemania sp. FL0916]